ncbi:MAG: 6-hydroxymethylpterin diphosphokinase MptE-like protein [Spirochaetota bacterium]
MDKQELYSRINDGMTQERFYSFERNLRLNKPFIRKCGGMKAVVPLLRGCRAVICGAGPSLDDAIVHLRKIREREGIAVIAADMAYRPLVRAGIIPHFAISCETTPRDFFAGCESARTRLLAFSCVNARTVREWQGPVHFYNWMLRREPYETLWREAGLDLGFAATGSIVTSQALSIALGCGVSEVMLVGNDLGFFDRCYARGTLRDSAVNNSLSRCAPCVSIEFAAAWKARHYVIPRGDRRYFTNHQFLAAKYWMEETIAAASVPVYDAGSPGCAGKNIEKISMKMYTDMIHARRTRR